ncbi:MAG: molecular chaperone TorD family protein [Oligoflexia bacterium]|nr:molecular chaperone TorD family protein [Oligoflexia bacterium]
MKEKLRINEFILGSLLTSYPDEAFSENMSIILKEETDLLPKNLNDKIKSIIEDQEKLDDLRSEYLRLFDSGRGVAPLYETEYGRQRALFKANELSAISGFYHAFGFELGGEDSAREMPDHISVEQEFYALLLLKQEHLEEVSDLTGIDIVLSARKKFMRDHLGRFVSSILDRPGVCESETYFDILKFVEKLVSTECQSLEVNPERAAWIDGEQESGEVTCGSTVGCLK